MMTDKIKVKAVETEDKAPTEAENETLSAEDVAFLKGCSKFLLIAIFIILLIIFKSCTYTVEKNQYAVTKQFGKVVNIVDEAGLHFKLPFIEDVSYISQKTLIYDLKASEVITKDKQTLVADCFVLWKVTNPQLFIQSLNGSIVNAQSKIEALTYSGMKQVISAKKQAEVISSRDDILASEIGAAIAKTVNVENEYGIKINVVETKHLDLPYDNKSSVYARMISERNNIAAAFTAEGEAEAQKIRSETDRQTAIMISEAKKEAEILIAEGEAEYMRILSDAYNDPAKANFYTFVRSLEAAKESLKNNENVLVLDKNNPLTEIFY